MAHITVKGFIRAYQCFFSHFFEKKVFLLQLGLRSQAGRIHVNFEYFGRVVFSCR